MIWCGIGCALLWLWFVAVMVCCGYGLLWLWFVVVMMCCGYDVLWLYFDVIVLWCDYALCVSPLTSFIAFRFLAYTFIFFTMCQRHSIKLSLFFWKKSDQNEPLLRYDHGKLLSRYDHGKLLSRYDHGKHLSRYDHGKLLFKIWSW